MKSLRFLLSMVAGVFFLCVATPGSLACSQPTTVTITYSWPPNVLVDALGILDSVSDGALSFLPV
jgi:hypothetical protein